jgi:alpha-galactosidase
VGDSWRILNDITFRVGWDGNPGIGRWFDPGTPSVTSQYNKAVVMDEFAGLDKGWNDPDMLMIGMDGMTDIQCKTHMTMWCMMNSPLMLGLDLRRVKKGDWIYEIIANDKLIALNQDSLGTQAKRLSTSVESSDPSKEYITNIDRVDILVKPLADGGAAISFINVSERKQTGDFKIMVDDIPFDSFKKGEKYKVTDLWTGEESVNTDGVFSVKELAACDNVTIRISVC